MPNRFFTILIIPEKTSRVRRIVLPSWLVRLISVGIAFSVLLAGMMLFNYWYVMSQIGENKQLKLENRRLRQQVQIFQNKIGIVENTMERVKSFATRLKVILHIEDQGPNLQGKLPDASSSIPNIDYNPTSASPSSSSNSNTNGSGAGDQATDISFDPEKLELEKEYALLDKKIFKLTMDAFSTEELLQDQYEVLYDKKSFLAALPTRQPAPGYFTSGFGVRASPYGDRLKMHEGLDIANRIGTLVRAAADGEVAFAGSKAGYGHLVVLNHGYGMETWYGHLKASLVNRGEKIKRGTKIALLGNTGRSTGPHLHYEVRVHSYPVDPRSYIFEDYTP